MNDKEYIKIYRIPPIFERKSKILVTFLEYWFSTVEAIKFKLKTGSIGFILGLSRTKLLSKLVKFYLSV